MVKIRASSESITGWWASKCMVEGRRRGMLRGVKPSVQHGQVVAVPGPRTGPTRSDQRLADATDGIAVGLAGLAGVVLVGWMVVVVVRMRMSGGGGGGGRKKVRGRVSAWEEAGRRAEVPPRAEGDGEGEGNGEERER
jgi:hypothetical protein